MSYTSRQTILQRIIVRLFLLIILALPSTSALAKTPDQQGYHEKTPTEQQYADWNALPLPPAPNNQKSEQKTAGFSTMEWGYDCNPNQPATSLYAKVVYQAYMGRWGILSTIPCSNSSIGPAELAYSSASNVYPRLTHRADRVVFSSNRTGNYEIYSVKTDNSDLRQLTNNAATDTYPTWSPDGSKIAFVSNREGDPDIYIMDSDGSNVRHISTSTLSDITPDWSPDGKKLAWVSADSSGGRIIIANITGNDKVYLSTPLRLLATPMWSHDGTRLAFEYDPNGDGWIDIGTINADGTGLTTLISSTGNSFDYNLGSWSPNDKFIIYNLTRYVMYDSEWYIEASSISKHSLDRDYHVSSFDTGQKYSFYPHMESFETDPPATRITPLPAFSPANGFSIDWMIRDDGSAGLYLHDMFIRTGATSNWTVWARNTYAGFTNPTKTFEKRLTKEYAGEPGTTVYFYGIGTDLAGNVEHQQPENTVFTRLYKWMVNSLTTDSRSNPLENISLTTTPASMNEIKSDAGGKSIAYLAGEGETQFQRSADGYAPSLPATLTVDHNQSFLTVLQPQENQILNGGFEDSSTSLDHWQTSGSLPTALANGHSGPNAALLGKNCAFPCLTSPEVLVETNDASNSVIAIEADGTIHTLHGATYRSRNPQGVWSQAQVLTTESTMGTSISLAVSPLGTVHALITTYVNSPSSVYAIYRTNYFSKPKNGEWSPGVVIAEGSYVQRMVVDSTDRVILLYELLTQEGSLFYRVRDVNGKWASPVAISPTDERPLSFDINLGPDNTPHIAFSISKHPTYYGKYIRVSPQGDIAIKEEFISSDSNWPIHIAAAPDGTVHIVVSGLRHWARTPDGVWTLVERKDSDREVDISEMEIDTKGSIHMVGNHRYGQRHDYYYYFKPAGESAFVRQTIPLGQDVYVNSLMDIILDTQNKAYIASYLSSPQPGSLFLQQTRVEEQSGQASLQQIITIPAGMHQPTLSFLYKLQSFWEIAQTGMTVTVQSDDGQPVEVLRSHVSGDWQHGWADLTPWAGKTVTIQFNYEQAANEPLTSLIVDEVSVGSWNTPILTALSPAHLQADSSPLTLTVIGQNFLPDAQVWLDQDLLPLGSVTWIDETQLQVHLPGTTPVGKYCIRVVNPGGTQSNVTAILTVGEFVYMPTITR